MHFIAIALQALQDLASLSLGRISSHFLPFPLIYLFFEDALDKGYFLTLALGETWLGPSMNLLQLAQRDSVRGRRLTQLSECSGVFGCLRV